MVPRNSVGQTAAEETVSSWRAEFFFLWVERLETASGGFTTALQNFFPRHQIEEISGSTARQIFFPKAPGGSVSWIYCAPKFFSKAPDRRDFWIYCTRKFFFRRHQVEAFPGSTALQIFFPRHQVEAFPGSTALEKKKSEGTGWKRFLDLLRSKIFFQGTRWKRFLDLLHSKKSRYAGLLGWPFPHASRQKAKP